jgi:hypothetical protein
MRRLFSKFITADPREGVISTYYRLNLKYLEYDLVITLREIRSRTLFALATFEFKAKHGAPPVFVCYPRPVNPGRSMTYMLIVTTGKPGNPVAFFIFVVSGDRLFHTAQVN